MICPKCKVRLSSDCKFCPRCGELFSSKETVLNLKDFNLEEKLLEVYFPSNKVYFAPFGISFGFLIGNFLYAFLKKVYDVAIINFLSFYIFLLMFFRGTAFIFESFGFSFMLVVSTLLLSIFIFIFYLFKFNDLYFRNVKYRVNKIIKENPDKNIEELIVFCEKDNKKNYLAFFLSLFLMLFLIFTLL